MIPVFRPCMGDAEVNAVAEVLRSGWIGLGPKTREFENRFAEYLGVRHAVAVNSATAALHLALHVMEVSGGEVISTPMTFVSTNHAILYNHAEPVFCDIEPDTLNMDVGKAASLPSPRTKAILVVHYGGHAVDMDPVMDLARRHNLKVIEDVAHGCGGSYKGKKLGAIGDIGCFSFHAVKNLATGDGGMITTNEDAIYQHLLKLRWVGITKDTWSRADNDARQYAWYYNVEELGYKYHMNDISAAIGLVQLDKLERMNDRRRALAKHYSKLLAGTPGIELPVTKPYVTTHACHNYVIKTTNRDALNAALKDEGIATGVHYIPNNHYDMYRNFRGLTPVSSDVWKRLLTLPLYPDLQESDVERIVATIRRGA
jgi:perosamine synthetase